MLQLYKNEWKHFKEGYARIFFWILIISLGFSVFSYFVLVSQPDVALKTMELVGQQIERQAEMFGGSLGDRHGELFWFIAKNNLYVTGLIFLVGFIPLVILPVFYAFVTFLSIGVLLAGIHVTGNSPLKALVFGILPHGIVEILALVLAASIAVFMSLQLFKKIFSRNRGDIRLGAVIWQSIRSYLLIVVPLIVIAALVEGFITPMLITLVY